MPPTFFICYRRADAGYAAALSGALGERHGRDRVFKDITDLRPADDWRAEVRQAIGRSTHVVVLVGPSWMAGVDAHGQRDGRLDPVAFELAEAVRAGRAIVPVLVGGARMPPAHHLPYALQHLPDLNAAYIRTESADADVAALVDRLPPPVSRPERLAARDVRSAPRPPARSGSGGFVGRLVALAVLGALVWGGVTLWGKVGGSAGGTGPAPSITEGNGPSPAKRSLTLDPGSGTTTTRITATGSGFTPGATVDIVFHVDHAADTVVGSDGTFRAPFTVPEDYGRFRGKRDWTVKAQERDAPGNSVVEYFTLSS